MITDNVKKALEDFKLITINMEADPKVKNLSDNISSLQDQLTDLQKELTEARKPWKTRLDETIRYISVHAFEIATSFEHMGVKVSYRKGYDRVTWKREFLDEFCIKNPALLSVLAPARKITPVDPSVSIAMLETDKESKE